MDQVEGDEAQVVLVYNSNGGDRTQNDSLPLVDINFE